MSLSAYCDWTKHLETYIHKDARARTWHFHLFFADKDNVYLGIQVLCTKIKIRDIKGVRQLWLYCLFKKMCLKAQRSWLLAEHHKLLSLQICTHYKLYLKLTTYTSKGN